MELLAVFGVGPQEGLLAIVVILLLFGAKRLPEIGKGMGKGIKEFRSGVKGALDDDDAEKPADKPAPKAPEKPADQ